MTKADGKSNRRIPRRVRTATFAVTPLLMFASTYALARTETMRGQRRRPREQPQPSPKTLFPRPFEGSYPPTLASAIIALVPFIIVTTAYTFFSRQIEGDLHVAQRAVGIVAGISTAGYAFGALIGGDLIQRFSQRPLFLACEALFVVGCLISAVGHGIVPYGAGRVIGRVFALVELVRSLADYIMAPVITRIAQESSRKPPLDWPGVHEAAGVTLWITVGFTVLGALLWIAGGIGLPVPDIQGWIKENKPAIRSPVLLARLRRPQPERGQ